MRFDWGPYMDFASIFGVVLGFSSLAFGYTMSGGSIKALGLLSAVIIVVGGTFGAVILSYGMKQLVRMPKLFLQVFLIPKSKASKTIDFLVMLSENARKDGLLSLEKIIESEESKNPIDPLLKRGTMMVIDGMDLEQIREILESDIAIYEQKSKTEISMFETMGGYAPAFGMIGTIVGLIQVLANMESPEQMASSIGVAFITTLYGVILANMAFLPTANKLKIRLNEYILEKEMIIEGICSIRNGINPKMLREKLSSYTQFDDKSGKKEGAGKTDKPAKASGKADKPAKGGKK